MKPRVLCTRELPGPAMTRLRQETELTLNTLGRQLTPEELLAQVRGQEGLLTMLADPITRAVLEAGRPTLKVVSNYAVGFNNIDVAAATELGIAVTNTPGVLTETTADLAWALLLAVARRVVEGDHFQRAGRFKGWEPQLLLGLDVFGKTLGIVGMGRIGQAVVRRAHGFSMRVLYFSHHRLETDEEKILGVTYAPLPQLLAESDFVSVHVPLTPETHHLIGERELRSMKKTAILVNTARGPVIDETALVRALQEGWIAGAGLDVYENEPLMAPGLAEQSSAVLLPHLGSASRETREKMATMAVDDLLALLRGERPAHLVNPEVWSKIEQTK
ncbi:MAG: D-glycerate dehydrogenase [Limnochordaceae bacterium]|nr:D-glycerate dehydrogenase [Limnochordaceae bacterium]